MYMSLHPIKTGLVFGLMVGGVHLLWSLLVLVGWGQPLADFIFWAHMVHTSYVVSAFDAAAAATLVVVSFVVAWAAGFVFASIWNKVHRM
jgi:hypothetical protein